MRIYRGNVGAIMTLNEFYDFLDTEDGIDDLLNIILNLEMDEIMNYNAEDIKEFEAGLFKEIEELQSKQQQDSDAIRMKRILQHLKKYES